LCGGKRGKQQGRRCHGTKNPGHDAVMELHLDFLSSEEGRTASSAHTTDEEGGRLTGIRSQSAEGLSSKEAWAALVCAFVLRSWLCRLALMDRRVEQFFD
jgi:hypothetical protein